MKNDSTYAAREPVYEVVWPLGRSAAGPPMRLSPPILDLSGKTIGELWSHRGDSDAFFPIIRESLRQRFPDIKFVHYDTFGDTHGANEAEVIAGLPGLLRQYAVDAVISGVGV
ncbi:MAG: hypothetical protein Q7O66_17805 [Dehalococcoidia bacterium]|nr:hypothetical protein [Dehalococcoidia bacterium]